jgi:hypothetical protein
LLGDPLCLGDNSASPRQHRLSSAEPLLGLLSGSRVEQRRPAGQNGSDDRTGLDRIAGHEIDTKQSASKRRCHDVAFAYPGLAILKDRLFKSLTLDASGLDVHGGWPECPAEDHEEHDAPGQQQQASEPPHRPTPAPSAHRRDQGD